MAEPGPLYTIRHSTLALDRFLAVLRGDDIGVLVDLRAVPRSRTNPQYNLDTLPAALAAAGMQHHYLPTLGGRRGRRCDLPGGGSPNTAWRNTSFRNYADYALTPAFQAGLDPLLGLATAPSPHRRRLPGCPRRAGARPRAAGAARAPAIDCVRQRAGGRHDPVSRHAGGR